MTAPIDGIASLPFQASPDAWLLLTVLAGGYAYLLATLGPTHAPTHLARSFWATRSQKLMFSGGVLLLFIGTSWPIHQLGEMYLYSFHMVQHLLFQLFAAPLLLLGTPAWLWRHLLTTKPAVFKAAKIAIIPGVAIILVSSFVAVAHIPGWVELSLSNGLFHLFTHVLWVLVGGLMWWPALSPIQELPHYSHLGRMFYLFSHSIVPTVPASFLTFNQTPFYPTYIDAPRVWAWLTPTLDLQIAGLLMKIGGGLTMWAVIAILFFQWSKESQTNGPDVLYWRDYAGADNTPELITR